MFAAARGGLFRLDAGGEVSGFNPDYGPNKLAGIGVYADARFTRWITIEGEARWLRFHQAYDIHQDTYLIGVKVPIKPLGPVIPYGKLLFGLGENNFLNSYAHGGYGVIAFGGGVDYRATRKWTLRGDVEVQHWPGFTGGAITPYGGSIGVAYRVF